MTAQRTFEGFEEPSDNKARLQAKFIVPPFSVLDTRQGYWQERKRLGVALGIQSEMGRGQEARAFAQDIMKKEYTVGTSRREADRRSNIKNAPKMPEYSDVGMEYMAPGTSIFDPVLCELMYKWFCPEGGSVLDPFAGGSVRGIVASILGYDYTGIDLSEPQIEANRQQAQEIIPSKQPEWIVGDSHKVDSLLPQGKHYDLVFTCPPYHDLEQYTDDMDDLSNMAWDSFKKTYSQIIAKSIMRLKDNRFACFVVSEIRDKVGGYKGLVPYTISAFANGGMRYYNEAILVNVAGSLPLRMAGQFAYRKLGKTHQNILVFYKGDIQAIPKHFKDISNNIPMMEGGNNDN